MRSLYFFTLISFLSAFSLHAEVYKCQVAVGPYDDYNIMNNFADDIAIATNGELEFVMVPKGEDQLVDLVDLVDSISDGDIPCGVGWTHYWDDYSPAGMLFGSPIAGAGLGIDQFSFFSWFMYGGGKELYDEMWGEMGLNIKGHFILPKGPEALGWFPEPIKSMDDFRKLVFRSPPGIPGQIYNDIGVESVAMSGDEIKAALESGMIDAAEWCCPKPDKGFGISEYLKHYYLQGLHQVIVNMDFYINKDLYDTFSDSQKRIIEVASNGLLMETYAYRIIEDGKALKELVNNDGVKLHDTPTDYFTEYSAAANEALTLLAEEDEFFAKVYSSMTEFAEIAIPYWSQAQFSNAQLGKAYAATLGD